MKILRKISFTPLFLVSTLPAATDTNLPNWNYKLDVVISNSGNAFTKDQVLIILDTQTLISAEKMHDDSYGIRFLNSNDSTQTFS